MKITKLALAMLTSGLFACSATAATGDGTVKFIGSVVSGACSIAPESANQVVDLGSITSKTLQNGGSSSLRTFEIKLEDCVIDEDSDAVSIQFDGSSVNQGEMLGVIQQNASNTSAGFGLQLLDSDSTPIKIGEATKSTHQLKNGENTLLYGVYAKGLSGADIEEGKFEAVTNFTITYQ